MFEAVLSGATAPEIEGVTVERRAALSVTAADAYLLGYMSGALKHAFDTFYYPCLDSTRGRPFGYYIHGNQGTEGAQQSIETITTGLGWEQAAAPVVITGAPDKAVREQCWELGATVSAQLTV
ncbi:flavodoxin [Nocardia terpenica]|uniref:Flavodoxin n=1 Tax=Nocardia terpenica TaxID=455432 RepID=A0A164P6B0_9NOCA|nr:flavodoxin [Nocardia terpenica]KZM75178.1 flavodoxin [Nocardia terpenica]NQE93470.1 flavodoxin family protein [Nocardia terpenica]